MAEQRCFIFYLNSKGFPIPSNSRYLTDISPEIYDKLTKNKFYIIKSKIKTNVLKSFINYLMFREMPNIDKTNLSDYVLLSKEFDCMIDLIQIYQNKINDIKSKNSLLQIINTNKKKIRKAKEVYESKINNYQQIIKKVFNNEVFESKCQFYKIKDKLFQACIDENA